MRALTLFVSVMLVACVGTPPFEHPRSAAPERYTSEPLSSLALDTAPDGSLPGDWWKQFSSAQLDATVAAALSGNRTLAAAQASLREAQELAGSQRGSRLPSVELEAGSGRQKYGAAFLGAAAGDFPPFTYYSIGASVSYALDYAGGIRSAIEERHSLAEVQQHKLEAARLTLIGNVVLQSLAVASAREQLRAAQSIVDEDVRNVDLVRKALEAGSVARLELLTAQSQLADDQTLLPPIRQQLSVARHALAVLVGQPPGNFAAPEFTLAEFALPSIALSLPSELAHRRPDILADEARLHAAAAEVGIATSNLYPQIRLTGSLSQQALSPDGLFEGASSAFGLVGNLTAPLFNGGKLRAQRRASIAAMEGALANYQQTVLTAFGQIADVLTALEHDSEQIAAQQNALNSAEANLSMTRESYAAGNVGVLQILDSQRLAQRARIGVVRAQAQRLQDTVELMVGLGGEGALP